MGATECADLSMRTLAPAQTPDRGATRAATPPRTTETALGSTSEPDCERSPAGPTFARGHDFASLRVHAEPVDAASQVSTPGDAVEREADQLGEQLASGL